MKPTFLSARMGRDSLAHEAMPQVRRNKAGTPLCLALRSRAVVWRGCVGLGVLVLAATLLITGCRSTRPPPGARFASVTITNRFREQIHDMTLLVFGEAGYTTGLVLPDEMVFERKSGLGDMMAYGNWMGGDAVWVRVKTEIVTVTRGTYRLQCNAFVVRDKGDARIEDETRLAGFRSGPYQKLLDEVHRRLQTPP